MIDITKKYIYRNGKPARILCVDAPGKNTVISLTKEGYILRHLSKGDIFPIGESAFDLIEVKEKRRLEFWVNIFADGEYMEWCSKELADLHAGSDRVARKHVVIEYKEEEFDA